MNPNMSEFKNKNLEKAYSAACPDLEIIKIVHIFGFLTNCKCCNYSTLNQSKERTALSVVDSVFVSLVQYKKPLKLTRKFLQKVSSGNVHYSSNIIHQRTSKESTIISESSESFPIVFLSKRVRENINKILTIDLIQQNKIATNVHLKCVQNVQFFCK